MGTTPREGRFWETIEGRLEPPPAAKLLGFRLQSIDPEQGTITVEFTARPEFLNYAGTVQGGILSAMLDDTMGPAAVAYLGGNSFAQTLELKTSFLRPVAPGLLIGEARVVHRGREIIFLESVLKTPDGKPVATATATARIVDINDRAAKRKNSG